MFKKQEIWSVGIVLFVSTYFSDDGLRKLWQVDSCYFVQFVVAVRIVFTCSITDLAAWQHVLTACTRRRFDWAQLITYTYGIRELYTGLCQQLFLSNTTTTGVSGQYKHISNTVAWWIGYGDLIRWLLPTCSACSGCVHRPQRSFQRVLDNIILCFQGNTYVFPPRFWPYISYYARILKYLLTRSTRRHTHWRDTITSVFARIRFPEPKPMLPNSPHD